MSLSYEDSIVRLQEVVTKLETGGLPLDESVALFQEGISLLADCNKLIEGAELTLEMLKDGQKKPLFSHNTGVDEEED